MSNIIHSGSLSIDYGDELVTATRVRESGAGPAILNAAIQGGEREGASTVDRLVGLVADKVFLTDIPNGEELVLPLSAAVLRVARRGFSAGSEKLRPHDHSNQVDIAETLWWMNTHKVDGCLQGDAALHYAAGLGAKNLERSMYKPEALKYCESKARAGYGRAVSQMRSGDARVAQLTTLIQRFPHAVAILSTLLEQRAA